MADKPVNEPFWTTGNPADVIEPSTPKKNTGWIFRERPPYQWFNWILYNIYNWINWAKEEIEHRPMLQSQATGIIMPMYIYPSSVYTNVDYNNVINLKKQHHEVPMYVILNVSSGPGTAPADGNYVAAVRRLQGAGIKVLGYVDTNYGAIPAATVEADIDLWKSLYNVDGIFFDQTTSAYSVANIDYLKDLKDYVHNEAMYPSVVNPGTLPDYRYYEEKVADIHIVFEGNSVPSEASLLGDFANGNADYDYKLRGGIIYGQSGFSPDDLNLMRKYLGWVMITDDVAPNPYDAVCTYLGGMLSVLSEPVTACTIGEIKAFYDFNELVALPPNYTYCNGQVAISAPNSPYDGQNMPDASGSYLIGFGTAGGADIDPVSTAWATAAVGAAGWTVDLYHRHTVAGHYHGKGNLNITASGSHVHTIPSFGSTPAGISMTVFNPTGTINSGSATHTHSSANFSGSVGNTGGSDGDNTINTNYQLSTTQDIRARSIRVRHAMKMY